MRGKMQDLPGADRCRGCLWSFNTLMMVVVNLRRWRDSEKGQSIAPI